MRVLGRESARQQQLVVLGQVRRVALAGIYYVSLSLSSFLAISRSLSLSRSLALWFALSPFLCLCFLCGCVCLPVGVCELRCSTTRA